MGHIELIVPVVHIWYFKITTKQNWLPSRIANQKTGYALSIMKDM